VAGFRQDIPPLDFRGSLLVDQMGLGKSQSMNALMAANPAGDLTHVVAKADRHLAPIKTTLLVVPSPRKAISIHLSVLLAYSIYSVAVLRMPINKVWISPQSQKSY
jgi:hypothetical protein